MEAWGQFLVGQLIVAAGIWGAIRADVRHLMREVNEAKESAAQAHQRIDRILMKGKA